MSEPRPDFEDVVYRDYDFMKLFYNTEPSFIPMHWHMPLEIIMSLENTYNVYIDGKKYALNEGDILIINSGVLHSMDADRRGVWFLLQLSLSAFEGKNIITPLTINFPSVIFLPKSGNEMYLKSAKIINDIRSLDENRTSITEITIFSMVLSLLTELALWNENMKNDEDTLFESLNNKKIIENICNFVNEKYAEEMSLEQAAALSGFSKFHFSRLFSKYTGDSFYRYVNKVRIKNAELMLSDASNSVTDVCFACGFPNMQSFIRLFKQSKGCTPGSFRKLMNEM